MIDFLIGIVTVKLLIDILFPIKLTKRKRD